MSDSLRFYFRGQIHQVGATAFTQTLLQYLREQQRATGTKEGCAEGDCGACTVVVAGLRDGELYVESVNACLQLLPTLDGKAVFTVEDLQQDGQLHPVQQALVDCHGSQCGFCTPGFVMSLWDLYLRREGAAAAPPRPEIDAALSGNLCRCTGYAPIIAAAQRMEDAARPHFDRAALHAVLESLQRPDGLHLQQQGRHFFAPRRLDALLVLRQRHPGACVLAGGTDIGLWVTKQLRDPGDLLYVGETAELLRIETSADTLEIGAAVPLELAYAAVCRHYDAPLRELWQRFASLPVRHAGTLGGNIANGSPIGDSMPWLIALGATVVLQSARAVRVLALEDFYLGYQKKDLQPDEIVRSLRIPLPRQNLIFRVYKLAKRRDQDISAVCAAFAATLEHGRLRGVRIACGGMAATPQRAARAEAALEGQEWDEAALTRATAALADDYTPLSDMRASAAYRMQAAQNLLRRFWLETRPVDPLPAHAVNAFAGEQP